MRCVTMFERVYKFTRGEADAVVELLAHEEFGDDPVRRAVFIQAIHIFETLAGSDEPVRLILEQAILANLIVVQARKMVHPKGE